MVRFSNSILGIFNFVIFVVSIPIFGVGIWLSTKADTICDKLLKWPVIAIGIFLMIVSLTGLVGSCCGVTWLLLLYVFVAFILILLVLVFTVFALIITNKEAGEVLSNRGYKKYRLGDYSNWLQKRVDQSGNWRKIKSCLHDTKVCKSLADDFFHELAKFYRKFLSPIQSGCCKPPAACGYAYVNATYWTGSATSTNTSNRDCAKWSNEQDQLCYDCDSCRAGVVANLKNDWRKIALVNVGVLIALVVVYSVGCCAYRNNQRDDTYGYK